MSKSLQYQVLEIREHVAFDRPDENQSVQAEGRCHVCLTAQTKEQPMDRALDSTHQAHQVGNCAKQEQNLAVRQVWFRFEGGIETGGSETREGK